MGKENWTPLPPLITTHFFLITKGKLDAITTTHYHSLFFKLQNAEAG
jgi:hypothetical protein